MKMMLQLNPPIPVITPKGKALAHFMIDYGIEHDLQWVCFQDSTCECWTWSNPLIRSQINITQGRDYASPFYNPSEVALNKKDKDKRSLAEVHKEAQIKYETIGQTTDDFHLGQSVKVITPCEDFHFFYGETGKVIEIRDDYVKIKFDEARVYEGPNGEDDWKMEDFSFPPEDLCCLKKANLIEKYDED